MSDDPKISRDDLSSSFRAFKDDLDSSADEAASKAIPVVAIAAGVLLVIVYMMGRRVGRTKSTVVEIRRI